MAEENTIQKPSADEATSAELTRCGACYRPHVDILEKADELVVLADVPGASGDSIDIDFEDGELTIYAKVEPRQDETAEFLTREYGIGDFHRTFRVSEAIDASSISAEYSEGVLTLHLPKAASAKPRKIAVKSA